jgi:hypothetical protein
VNNTDKNSKGVNKPPVLRVADIIPPLHNDLINESQQIRTNNGLQNNQVTGQQNTSIKENSEIPKFDVAQQILAEQRKYSARKRVSPADHRITGTQEQKKKQNAEHEAHTTIQQDIIVIKEIVRRDIEKFCQNKLRYR